MPGGGAAARASAARAPGSISRSARKAARLPAFAVFGEAPLGGASAMGLTFFTAPVLGVRARRFTG
jgi:hypothetical protein